MPGRTSSSRGPGVPRIMTASAIAAQRDAIAEVLANRNVVLGELELELESSRSELAKLRASRTYRVASALAQARAGSVGGLIGLPQALWRALMSPVEEPILPPGTKEDATFRRFEAKPRIRRPLRIIAVVDTFTEQSLLGECELMLPGPATGECHLDDFDGELLFVESAWHGNRGGWTDELHENSPHFHRLLKYAHIRRMPTVFWNKEDPVHYEHFISLARHFDHVMTTAVENIPDYRQKLVSDNVSLMPFACQPRLHNPVEAGDRRDAFVFAGSFYPQYPERNETLRNMVEELSRFAPVDIFDRNMHRGIAELAFPPDMAMRVVGSLPPDEVMSACKHYRYALNVNTVTTSQTMLARRVFELAATGTVVFSNSSPAISRLFGDIVVMASEKDEWGCVARSLHDDPVRVQRLALHGVRKVLSEHTWAHRVALLARIARGEADSPDSLRIFWIAPVSNKDELEHVVSAYRRQLHRDCRLMVVSEWMPGTLPEGCHWLTPEKADAMEFEPGVAFAGCNPHDWYGPGYLWDMALAAQYFDGAGVGKRSYWVRMQDDDFLVDQGACYRETESVGVHRALLFRPDALFKSPGRMALAIGLKEQIRGHFLGLDNFNYCENASSASAPADDGGEQLDTGLSLADFISFQSDCAVSGQSVQTEVST